MPDTIDPFSRRESATVQIKDVEFTPRRPNGNTVTVDSILCKIKTVSFTILPDGVTTICQATLENGFTVNGYSAVADPANFDAQLGQTYSYKDAVRQIWPLEGYLLKQRMYEKSLPEVPAATKYPFVTRNAGSPFPVNAS